jgi:nucleoside-diphosphate-sugar epimerase
MENIAVIGGAGYIGSYLCKYLPATPDPVNTRQFKVIIYLGGISKRSLCNSSWEHTYTKNVTDVVNFVKELDSDSQFIIYASTGAICTTGDLDNYSKSMLMREEEISKLKIPSIGLRIAGVVGKSPKMRMDLVYHSMMDTALKGQPIQVHDPLTMRGVLWLNDLLEGIRAILRGFLQGATPFCHHHAVFELCSFNATILEIASDISKATGSPYEIANETGNRVPGFKLDNTAFSKAFGFSPKGTRQTVIADLTG